MIESDYHWTRSGRNWETMKARARRMRKNPTPAERALWERLRGKRLDGMKFRRQHVIDRIIVDFFCPQMKLVIEVDGSAHADADARDRKRDSVLRQRNLRLLRFTNKQVLRQMEWVLAVIRRFVRGRSGSQRSAG